jgi:hypothetical protein
MSNRRRANLTTSLSTAPASSPQASIIPRSRIPSRSYWLPLPRCATLMHIVETFSVSTFAPIAPTPMATRNA